MQRYRRFGEYVLLRKIATGGMADVHLALKRGPATFDRIVALKTILRHHTDHEAFVSMFYNEARLGARFNHPNLLNVFDVRLIDDTLTMVMEYVPGATVSELVTRCQERRLEFRRPIGIRIVLDACLGLHHAHHLRDLDGTPLTVVHRDVSPQNILVGYSGQVKVFDFGIAHSSGNGESEQLAGVLAGKYAYMSPEQCHGGQLDERSDVFSLGIMLWELTTQKRLFRRKNQIDVLRAITDEPIAAPGTLVESYPRGLERVVMAALQRDPEARPQTALELHDELLKYAALADEQISSTSLGRFMEEVFSDEIHSEWASLALALQQVEEAEMAHPVEPSSTGDEDRPAAEVDEPDEEHEGDMALEALVARTVADSFDGDPIRGHLHASQEIALATALRRSRRLSAVLAVALFFALAAASTAGLLLATGRTAGSAPPSSTPDAGQLAIDSEPTGATIFVDGVQRAETTPAVVELPLGQPTHVRLTREGFHDAIARVTATPETPHQSLGLALISVDDEPTGTVRIVTSPPDASVTIDQLVRGNATPLVVRDLALDEPHTLRVEREGFEPRELGFELVSAATREIRVELQEAVDLGALTVTSEPSGAQVLIDGEPAGLTPLEHVPLVSGRAFVVELVLDGYRPHRATVELAPNEEQVIDERLARQRRATDRAELVEPPPEDTPEPPATEPTEEPYELLR